MKNRELFYKDPLSWHILNEGVTSNNTADLNTLRYELETFVCQGEYHSGLVKILHGYLENLGKEQKAAWVSGFYGSGKSHLVKVLRHLWTDYKFDDGSTARNLSSLPVDVSDLLKELTTKGKRGAGLHSAGGTLKAGVGSVRIRLLGIIFQSVGLPEKVSIAKLIMDLRDSSHLDAVRKSLQDSGKNPDAEFKMFYTSKVFHEAYLKTHPHLGDIKNASEALRAQYPAKREDMSIDEMVEMMRRAISRDKKLPCTVVVLDEVQQFINNSPDVALEVQEVVEACCKKLDGQVLFVGTGQSALSDSPSLQKLMGRFTIKIHLKDNDVEKVVRTVVLRKKEDCKKDIEDLVTRQSGEIMRQLKSTRIASCSEDDESYTPDYPLLPVRRRFWEKVLHSIDPTGTTAQMRTQLRVTHEACKQVADKSLGHIIPADFIYDQLASDLVITGEMQKRFQEIVEEQKSKPDGILRSRICSLTFLINKLPREGADIGVRANAEHLADLLTDDLGTSAVTLREKVPAVVQALVSEGILMEVEGEFRLQTTEGAGWEGEFRRRQSSAANNDAQVASVRGRLIAKALQDELDGISVLQGKAREKRKVVIHYGSENPSVSDGVLVWVRDGFQESESSVVQDIQRRSVDDATIHVLIAKTKTDELKKALSSIIAAEETLNYKGHPTNNEGRDARAAMQTRFNNSNDKVKDLIVQVLSGTRVFLSGGQDLPLISLRETVQNAASRVLSRLYPKFDMADNSSWPMVWKKAKEGNPAALQAVGYQGDPDKHPVAAEVIRYMGPGKSGAELIDQFTTAPYGWPRDAIHAIIASLITSGYVGARYQGQSIRLADLDQRKVNQADYRLEHPVLTAIQKLRIRQLFQEAKHPFSPGEEGASAPSFVQALKELAMSAGGEQPAPEPPKSVKLIALEGLTGNDLLYGLHEQADELTKKIIEWKDLAEKKSRRLTMFETAAQLLRYAVNVDGVGMHVAELDAIRKNRSLLDDPDPVDPIIKGVGAALRKALTQTYTDYGLVLKEQYRVIEGHPAWKSLPESKRDELLSAAGVVAIDAPVMNTDQDLLRAFERCDLAHWKTLADALPTRFTQALSSAIQLAEPKAKRLTLPSATIRNQDELEAWIKQAREYIEKSLKDGPVIL